MATSRGAVPASRIAPVAVGRPVRRSAPWGMVTENLRPEPPPSLLTLFSQTPTDCGAATQGGAPGYEAHEWARSAVLVPRQKSEPCGQA